MKLNELNNNVLRKGLPPKSLTSTEWESWFSIMKLTNKPSQEKRFTAKSTVTAEQSDKNETQWYRYRQFINSCLSVIRKGEVDYCYYLDQIVDLLRFEPNLKTKYYQEDRYFEVWL